MSLPEPIPKLPVNDVYNDKSECLLLGGSEFRVECGWLL